MTRRLRRSELALTLERMRVLFDPASVVEHDPVGVVRGHDREDWEVVAHVAAALAYGSVALVRRAIVEVLEVLGSSPRARIERFVAGDFVAARPRWVYRMTRARDIDAYLSALGQLLVEYGSLEAAFIAGDDGVGDVHEPLAVYVARIRERMPLPLTRGMRYLTPDPHTGSACKRWHLMLRWLVRPDDGADLGLWTKVAPARLVMPLDTHTTQLAQSLGLSSRKSVDYKMAREVTDALARIRPADPLAYDLPLCHLGISGKCMHRFVEPVCAACDLRGVCRWTRSRA